MKSLKITEETAFLLIYGVWFLILNLTRTYFIYLIDLALLKNLAFIMTYLFLFWHFMSSEKLDKNTKIKIILFAGVGIISWYFSKTSQIFSMIALCICARKMDYKKIFKVYIAIALAVLAVTSYASVHEIIQTKITEGERVRLSLGYTYYSYPSHIIFFISMAYIAIRKKTSPIELGILFAANYIFYQITDTKVPYYAACVILICSLILWCIKTLQKKQEIVCPKWIRMTLVISPFLFLIFSYFIHGMYDSNSVFWVRLNEWLNTRLSLGHAGIFNIPNTLFGQEIIWDDWAQLLGFGDYFFIDNSYINIMLNQGVLYMFMILIGYASVLRRAILNRSDSLVLAILGCLIFGLVDPELADPRFQPMVLLIGWMLNTTNNINDLSCS